MSILSERLTSLSLFPEGLVMSAPSIQIQGADKDIQAAYEAISERMARASKEIEQVLPP